MDGLIPQKHCNYLRDFFLEEPEVWEMIKNDIDQLRAWAKALKELGWYNVDDKTKYEYCITRISMEEGVNVERY
jgi:hypothetical protein